MPAAREKKEAKVEKGKCLSVKMVENKRLVRKRFVGVGLLAWPHDVCVCLFSGECGVYISFRSNSDSSPVPAGDMSGWSDWGWHDRGWHDRWDWSDWGGWSADSTWQDWNAGYEEGYRAARWEAQDRSQCDGRRRQDHGAQDHGARASQREHGDSDRTARPGDRGEDCPRPPRVDEQTKREIKAYARQHKTSVREAERVLLGLFRTAGGQRQRRDDRPPLPRRRDRSHSRRRSVSSSLPRGRRRVSPSSPSEGHGGVASERRSPPEESTEQGNAQVPRSPGPFLVYFHGEGKTNKYIFFTI